MNWNKWVRQMHRWLSLAFTVGVVANLVAMGFSGRSQEGPAVWVGLLALLPLVLLLASGLYLFLLPYVPRIRGRAAAAVPSVAHSE